MSLSEKGVEKGVGGWMEIVAAVEKFGQGFRHSCNTSASLVVVRVALIPGREREGNEQIAVAASDARGAWEASRDRAGG